MGTASSVRVLVSIEELTTKPPINLASSSNPVIHHRLLLWLNGEQICIDTLSNRVNSSCPPFQSRSDGCSIITTSSTFQHKPAMFTAGLILSR